MNKSQLAAALATHTGSTKTAARAVLDALFDPEGGLIVTALKDGDGVVSFPGFGSWKKSDRAARMGRNPATGEHIRIPAKTVVRFSVGKKFKEAVLAPAPRRGRK